MTRTKTAVTALTTGLLVSAFALAAHAGPGERIARKLGLTEDQQASVEQIRETYRPNRDEVRAKRSDVRALVENGEVDAAAELAATHAREAVYRRAQMRAELSEVLTPEQMAELESLMEQRMNNRSRAGRGQRSQAQDSDFGL